jgi:hypothetical protein
MDSTPGKRSQKKKAEQEGFAMQAYLFREGEWLISGREKQTESGGGGSGTP